MTFKKISINLFFSLTFSEVFIALVKLDIISLGVPVLKRYALSKACLGMNNGQAEIFYSFFSVFSSKI